MQVLGGLHLNMFGERKNQRKAVIFLSPQYHHHIEHQIHPPVPTFKEETTSQEEEGGLKRESQEMRGMKKNSGGRSGCQLSVKLLPKMNLL